MNEMRESFEKHIAEIFRSLNVKTVFEVYDCSSDIKPLLGKMIGVSHEYLVCCEENEESQRLVNFTGKKTFSKNGVLYWFDGDNTVLEPNGAGTTYFPENHEPISNDSHCIQLPKWIDDLIFQLMGATYAPSGESREFDSNLDLSKDKLMVYLGTYFPRSYAESYSIWCNLFSNDVIKKEYTEKRTIGSYSG